MAKIIGKIYKKIARHEGGEYCKIIREFKVGQESDYEA